MLWARVDPCLTPVDSVGVPFLLPIDIETLTPFVHNLAASMCANGAWFVVPGQN